MGDLLVSDVTRAVFRKFVLDGQFGLSVDVTRGDIRKFRFGSKRALLGFRRTEVFIRFSLYRRWETATLFAKYYHL